MNLLRYEYIDGPDGSINGMLRKLVTDLRYNRSMVSIDEFKNALPELQKIERLLQKMDRDIDQPHRNYIEEIMAELNQESEDETNLVEDLSRATKAIISSLIDEHCDFDNFLYAIGKSEHYHWLRFYGYNDERMADASLVLSREVFRSICNKYNYIFIDLSLN